MIEEQRSNGQNESSFDDALQTANDIQNGIEEAQNLRDRGEEAANFLNDYFNQGGNNGGTEKGNEGQQSSEGNNANGNDRGADGDSEKPASAGEQQEAPGTGGPDTAATAGNGGGSTAGSAAGEAGKAALEDNAMVAGGSAAEGAAAEGAAAGATAAGASESAAAAAGGPVGAAVAVGGQVAAKLKDAWNAFKSAKTVKELAQKERQKKGGGLGFIGLLLSVVLMPLIIAVIVVSVIASGIAAIFTMFGLGQAAEQLYGNQALINTATGEYFSESGYGTDPNMPSYLAYLWNNVWVGPNNPNPFDQANALGEAGKYGVAALKGGLAIAREQSARDLDALIKDFEDSSMESDDVYLYDETHKNYLAWGNIYDNINYAEFFAVMSLSEDMKMPIFEGDEIEAKEAGGVKWGSEKNGPEWMYSGQSAFSSSSGGWSSPSYSFSSSSSSSSSSSGTGTSTAKTAKVLARTYTEKELQSMKPYKDLLETYDSAENIPASSWNTMIKDYERAPIAEGAAIAAVLRTQRDIALKAKENRKKTQQASGQNSKTSTEIGEPYEDPVELTTGSIFVDKLRSYKAGVKTWDEVVKELENSTGMDTPAMNELYKTLQTMQDLKSSTSPRAMDTGNTVRVTASAEEQRRAAQMQDTADGLMGALIRKSYAATIVKKNTKRTEISAEDAAILDEFFAEQDRQYQEYMKARLYYTKSGKERYIDDADIDLFQSVFGDKKRTYENALHLLQYDVDLDDGYARVTLENYFNIERDRDYVYIPETRRAGVLAVFDGDKLTKENAIKHLQQDDLVNDLGGQSAARIIYDEIIELFDIDVDNDKIPALGKGNGNDQETEVSDEEDPENEEDPDFEYDADGNLISIGKGNGGPGDYDDGPESSGKDTDTSGRSGSQSESGRSGSGRSRDDDDDDDDDDSSSKGGYGTSGTLKGQLQSLKNTLESDHSSNKSAFATDAGGLMPEPDDSDVDGYTPNRFRQLFLDPENARHFYKVELGTLHSHHIYITDDDGDVIEDYYEYWHDVNLRPYSLEELYEAFGLEMDAINYAYTSVATEDNNPYGDHVTNRGLLLEREAICRMYLSTTDHIPTDHFPETFEELQEACKSGSVSLLGPCERTPDTLTFEEYKALRRKRAASGYRSAVGSGFVGDLSSLGLDANTIRQYGKLSHLDRAEVIWNFFKEKGWSDLACASILGNFEAESSLNPNCVERGNNNEGLGLGQWSYGRKPPFKRFMAAHGYSTLDLSAECIRWQCEYIIVENSWSIPCGSYFPAGVKHIAKAKSLSEFGQVDFPSIKDAVDDWCWHWEQPGYRSETEKTNQYKRRIAAAIDAYERFAGPISLDASLFGDQDLKGLSYIDQDPAMAMEYYKRMIAVAESCLGTPYKMGCSTPGVALDCSAFVSYVINNSGFGINIGRQATEGLRAFCTPISVGEARPGDIIFFKDTYDSGYKDGVSHVGIYVGKGTMIHSGKPCQYASCTTDYWQSHFLSFGRIPGLPAYDGLGFEQETTGKVDLSKITSEKTAVSLDSSFQFAGNSKIHSGSATLYKNIGGAHEDTVICVNAGHGTKGGTKVKTLCHPDGTPKTTGGSTAAGETHATAVSTGMEFKNGTEEAVVTLKEAIFLKEELLSRGYSVLMIRESSDVQLDNIARTVLANNYADAHIAIHWDSSSNDKGAFFMSVPGALRKMYPVSQHADEHEELGRSLIRGLKANGVKIHGNGEMAMDLTQTSYSTIASVDIELGDKGSDIGEAHLRKLAKGLADGVDIWAGN